MLTNFLFRMAASVMPILSAESSRLLEESEKAVAVNQPYRGTALGLLEAEGHI